MAITISTSLTHAGCLGQANGSINITVTGGGTPPYDFSWSNGYTNTHASLSSITGLTSGAYWVKITDGFGNTGNYPFLVSASALSIDFEVQHPNTVGSAKVIPSGGESPYTYLWSTGATTQKIDSLSAGIYYVTVTDAYGCQRTDSITLVTKEQSQMNLLYCCKGDLAYTNVWARRNGLKEMAQLSGEKLILLEGYLNDLCKECTSDDIPVAMCEVDNVPPLIIDFLAATNEGNFIIRGGSGTVGAATATGYVVASEYFNPDGNIVIDKYLIVNGSVNAAADITVGCDFIVKEEAEIAGKLTAASVRVESDMEVGDIEADYIEVFGDLLAANITAKTLIVHGDLEADSLNSTCKVIVYGDTEVGEIVVAEAEFKRDVETDTIVSTCHVTVGGELDATGSVEIGGNLTANEITIDGNLTVQGILVNLDITVGGTKTVYGKIIVCNPCASTIECNCITDEMKATILQKAIAICGCDCTQVFTDDIKE